jgi:hypothetical protein
VSDFLPEFLSNQSGHLWYWESQQEVWVNATCIAKISANPKNGSNHKYFAGERQVQENPEFTQRCSNTNMQNTTGRYKRIIQLNECMLISSDIPPGA